MFCNIENAIGSGKPTSAHYSRSDGRHCAAINDVVRAVN